ncbi:L-type lectin family protein [Companilactobacillus jidongensis]|uniref:hypothetical protein n=1 Tax=Companilactobacillus jidongensis TaxID=2486006 RepID=UPI000F7A8FBD|nr:hypothetical protein [Companilactobacillus jidongensis]
MKKLGLFVATSIIVFLTLININTTNVKAGYYSDSDAMAYAPYGLPLGDLGSDSLFIDGAHTTGNDASIDGTALQLTQAGQTNEVTSVWSNTSKDNYIDTGKKQTLSVWLYFGYSLEHSEGMAFVLQNDSRGPLAISKNGDEIAGGETIGVWGSDLTNKDTTQDVADSAIQNSWALEFDSNVEGSKNYDDITNNTGNGPGESLDSYQLPSNRGINDQHIAWAYPGLATTYANIGSVTKTIWKNVGIISMPTTVKTNYYEMLHNDLEELTLSPAATPE